MFSNLTWISYESYTSTSTIPKSHHCIILFNERYQIFNKVTAYSSNRVFKPLNSMIRLESNLFNIESLNYVNFNHILKPYFPILTIDCSQWKRYDTNDTTVQNFVTVVSRVEFQQLYHTFLAVHGRLFQVINVRKSLSTGKIFKTNR